MTHFIGHMNLNVTLYWVYDYLSMLGLKLIHASKMGLGGKSCNYPSPSEAILNKRHSNIVYFFTGYTVPTYGGVEGPPYMFFNIMLSHTWDLTSHPFDIRVVARA